MRKKTKSVTLDTERDAELLAWIDTLSNFARVARESLYQTYHQTTRPNAPPDLEAIRQVVRDELRRSLAGLQLAKGEQPQAEAEDTDPALELNLLQF